MRSNSYILYYSNKYCEAIATCNRLSVNARRSLKKAIRLLHLGNPRMDTGHITYFPDQSYHVMHAVSAEGAVDYFYAWKQKKG